MSHNMSITTCKDVELNKIDVKDFKATDYFPDDYKIQRYSIGGKRETKNKLLGKEAPEWTLQTADKLPFSLENLKSNVIMIQFTSVSCGLVKLPFHF